MSWAVIIAELFKLLGPIIVKWLEGWLNSTSKELPVPTGDKEKDSRLLLETSIKRLKGRPFRRIFLRTLLATAPKALARGRFETAEKAELKAAAINAA